MAFFEVNTELMNIILIAMGIALVVGVVVVVALKIHRSNKANKETQQACEMAVAQAIERATMVRNDYLVMSRNITYKVGPDGEIAMGQYVLKSAVSTEDTFNLRHNGLVQSYKNGDVIVLGGGDTLCSVSGSVLIKPFQE